MKKLLSFILLIVLTRLGLLAQGDLDNQQKIFYRNEKTIALTLYNNGFGIGYREGKRLDYLNKRIIDLEIATIKHPKEVKQANPYGQARGNFVFGKLNNVYALRAGIGHQKEIFTKKDLGGVSIRYLYMAGVSLALTKPIYYRVRIPRGLQTYEDKEEKFNAETHLPTYVISRASFFKGIDEGNVIPGAFLKVGFVFEYSKEDKIIHAIEFGLSPEAYIKKIPIMATGDNSAFFFNLFVSYRFGFVVNPFEPESSRIKTLFFKRKKAK